MSKIEEVAAVFEGRDKGNAITVRDALRVAEILTGEQVPQMKPPEDHVDTVTKVLNQSQSDLYGSKDGE